MKPRIAVFSGPTATILNSWPLVTSDKAMEKYGLPRRRHADGSAQRFDVLRPQRLAAPVTVYVEQFTAHPLERDSADLYAPPDGYLDSMGVFHGERTGPDDTPVYEVTLRPEDGLYPLPYMARQANGQAWDEDCSSAGGDSEEGCRQPFFPDAARLFEEIDRLEIGADGLGDQLARRAAFDFFRAAPSGGYRKGLPEEERTDVGIGDVSPERLGEDFFPYRPKQARREPPRPMLARLTNQVQDALASGQYQGAIWLEGSPYVEETAYWLNLLIDTELPIACNAGSIGTPGRLNVIASVIYLCSGIWADEYGKDSVGVVGIQDEQVFTAREIQKSDERPGGYIATGGQGGVVASVSLTRRPVLTFRPVRAHTQGSQVNLARLPAEVDGIRGDGGTPRPIRVPIKDAEGRLLGSAIPTVTIVKHARYLPDDASSSPASEVDILARIERSLREAPLAGFVAEGSSPYADLSATVQAALRRATFSGMPVVKVGRGNADGMVPHSYMRGWAIAGSNLTATKARILLMACLMRLGSLPPAVDPDAPTDAEKAAVEAKLSDYQAIFDTH